MPKILPANPPAIFPMEDLSIEYLRRSKDKPPVVFVHGNSQNKTCGKGLLEFFAKKGHSTLCYDLPGHGESVYRNQSYQFSDLIDLNATVLKNYDIKNPILCGHSLGGMILAGYVSKYQIKQTSLVLCGSLDANPSYVGAKYLKPELAKQLSDALNEYMNDGFKLFKRQKIYDYFENREVADEIINIINRRYSNPAVSKTNLQTLGSFDVRQSLAALKIPILTLHGNNEQVIHSDLVEAMKDEYSTLRQAWYPTGGHLAFYQEYELTNRYLDDNYAFLTGIGNS